MDLVDRAVSVEDISVAEKKEDALFSRVNSPKALRNDLPFTYPGLLIEARICDFGDPNELFRE